MATEDIQVFHYPELEGKRLVSFQVSEPGGRVQLIFEGELQAQIGAELATRHPSLRHGASRVQIDAVTTVHTFVRGASAELRERIL